MTEVLQKWSRDFEYEEIRAIRGIGKYRLAPGFDQFFIEQLKWNQWGPERQTEHIKKFRRFIPAMYDTYKKPNKAGLKSSRKSKSARTRLPSPELFEERNPVPTKKACVTPS